MGSREEPFELEYADSEYGTPPVASSPVPIPVPGPSRIVESSVEPSDKENVPMCCREEGPLQLIVEEHEEPKVEQALLQPIADDNEISRMIREVDEAHRQYLASMDGRPHVRQLCKRSIPWKRAEPYPRMSTTVKAKRSDWILKDDRRIQRRHRALVRRRGGSVESSSSSGSDGSKSGDGCAGGSSGAVGSGSGVDRVSLGAVGASDRS